VSSERSGSKQNRRLAPESVDPDYERNEQRKPDIEVPIVPKAERLCGQDPSPSVSMMVEFVVGNVICSGQGVPSLPFALRAAAFHQEEGHLPNLPGMKRIGRELPISSHGLVVSERKTNPATTNAAAGMRDLRSKVVARMN
jgi:hypothetical protein